MDPFLERPEIYATLREKILQGQTATDCVRFLFAEMQWEHKYKIPMIYHFKCAFEIDIGTLKHLAAWDYFEGNGWSEESVNSHVTPLLKERAEKIKNGEYILSKEGFEP